jgi:hypothetical protein
MTPWHGSGNWFFISPRKDTPEKAAKPERVDFDIAGPAKFDMAAKRRKKHKSKISELVISMCYNEQKSKFSLFSNPSNLNRHCNLAVTNVTVKINRSTLSTII